MNKELARIQQEIERANEALGKLEEAIDAGDNNKIGAALYELRRALTEAEHEAHETHSRQ